MAAGISPWSEIKTLCRRVCLLRARGLDAEAAQLETTDLARALDTMRSASGRDCEAELRSIFAAEETRVTDAALLAEILLPLLRDSGSASAATPLATPAVARASRPAAASVPGIADFIDEMISLEREFCPASAGAGSRR